jgi:hypothetical protein
MDDYQLYALLQSMEWSGTRHGEELYGGLQESSYASCPHCLGIWPLQPPRTMPGWPIEAVGHHPNCALKEAIDNLSGFRFRMNDIVCVMGEAPAVKPAGAVIMPGHNWHIAKIFRDGTVNIVHAKGDLATVAANNLRLADSRTAHILYRPVDLEITIGESLELVVPTGGSEWDGE